MPRISGFRFPIVSSGSVHLDTNSSSLRDACFFGFPFLPIAHPYRMIVFWFSHFLPIAHPYGMIVFGFCFLPIADPYGMIAFLAFVFYR